LTINILKKRSTKKIGEQMAKENKVEEVNTKKELIYKPDIEKIYTNHTQFFLTENDITFHLGSIEHLPDKQVTVVTHSVVMSHNHAKKVQEALTKVLDYYEKKEKNKK
jgi:hypothetical protein